jgi:hypothetical protein
VDTVPESNLHALRIMKQATGLTMRVTPYEVVTRIKQVTETTIVVQLRVYQAEERRTEVILKNQGTRLVQYSLTDHGWAQAGPTVTAWDDDFQPVYQSLYGPGKTVEEWYRARAFEAQCNRPGTDSHPLDSANRTAAYNGQYSTTRMVRHWA